MEVGYYVKWESYKEENNINDYDTAHPAIFQRKTT